MRRGISELNDVISPVKLMYQCVEKYGLSGEVKHFTGSVEQCIDIVKWKSLVLEKVIEFYTVKWKMKILMYPKLKLLESVVSEYHMSIWWKLCRRMPKSTYACKVIMKLITGEHYVLQILNCAICVTRMQLNL